MVSTRFDRGQGGISAGRYVDAECVLRRIVSMRSHNMRVIFDDENVHDGIQHCTLRQLAHGGNRVQDGHGVDRWIG